MWIKTNNRHNHIFESKTFTHYQLVHLDTIESIIVAGYGCLQNEDNPSSDTIEKLIENTVLLLHSKCVPDRKDMEWIFAQFNYCLAQDTYVAFDFFKVARWRTVRKVLVNTPLEDVFDSDVTGVIKTAGIPTLMRLLSYPQTDLWKALSSENLDKIESSLREFNQKYSAQVEPLPLEISLDLLRSKRVAYVADLSSSDEFFLTSCEM